MSRFLHAAMGALALAGLAAGGAEASVVSFQSGAPLSANPFVVTIGGAGSFTFTGASTGNGPAAAVQSVGTNQVASFFGSIADFEAGSSIDQTGELYSFTAFSPAALIPNSAADDFIGLAFQLADGVHYGYAEVAGASLVGYGYDTTPGASILTGDVPEPASIALLLIGAASVVAAHYRRRA